MQNIWTYSTQENGLSSNNVCDIAGKSGGVIYAATDKGISASEDFGKTWHTAVERKGDSTGEASACVNQHSGTVLFSYQNDQGLGVKPKDGEVYYIVEQNGIYSNKVNSVDIDNSIAPDDTLGSIYISYYSGTVSGGELADRTFSIHRPGENSSTWHTYQPAEFNGVVTSINRIKCFNGTVYVCASGALAISSDCLKWNVIQKFKINMRPGIETPIGAGVDVKDFYIDSDGSWHLISNFLRDNVGTGSFALKSNDNGSTWDIVLYSSEVSFNYMATSGDNVFFCSEWALRVFNRKNESVKLFNDKNGLSLKNAEDANLSLDKFLIDEKNVYIPTGSGVAIASLADIAQYPPLFDYATTETGLSSNTVLCVTAGRADTALLIILAGGDKGLSGSVDGGKSWKNIHAVSGADLRGQQINDIQPCWLINQDYYAIATEQTGLVICNNPMDGPDGLGWCFTTAEGLASNRATCVFADLSGQKINAYVGHKGEGLTSILDGKCTVFNTSNGLAGNYVLSIRQGIYQGKGQLYACGYNLASSMEGSRATLSVSNDGGQTWKGGMPLIDGSTVRKLYDVWCDTKTKTLYGFFALYDSEAGPMMLAKSIDNGACWSSVYVPTTDGYDENCNPKLCQVGTKLYVASINLMHLLAMEIGTKETYAYWEDGLRGQNTGTICVDANGQIYVGSRGLGLAISNLEYVPMYETMGNEFEHFLHRSI